MKWATAFGLVLLVVSARAQVSDPYSQRDMAVLWAEYYAAIYKVPIELVAAIIDEESGWNPQAVSKKGAAGIMQLMPATARRFGAQPVCGRGKHSWRSRISGLAETEISR